MADDLNQNKPVDNIDLLVKENEEVLRSIITNTPKEQEQFIDGNVSTNLLSFIGSKMGKVYKDIMMKLTIQKMDLYTFHTDYQDFLIKDKEYKDKNDIDKLNIKNSIQSLKDWIGTIDDYKNNLN